MLEQAMIEKLLNMRLQGMADGAQGAGAGPVHAGAEFRRTPVLINGSAVKLAREPSVGAATEERRASSPRLYRRHRLPCGAGTGEKGPTLAQKACRDGHSAFYTRAAALFRDLALARADGSFRNLAALPVAICDSRESHQVGFGRGEGERIFHIALLLRRWQRSFAAGFGGSTRIFSIQDLPNTSRVALSGGRTEMFRPVSCGGSCGPANLWWEQNGVMYQIQIKLGSGSPEKCQEKILVETANSMVTARRE